MHVIIITHYALVLSHVKAMAEEANNIIATVGCFTHPGVHYSISSQISCRLKTQIMKT